MKFLKILLVFPFLFIVFAVHAQSSAELKRQREELTRQLDQLNREYEQTASNKRTTLKQLSILRQQINLRQEKINNINSEIRNLDNQISESSNNIRNLQSQLDLLKKDYAAMILFAYHNRSSYNKLMFIFAAKDFNQAYKRLKYLQQIGGYRERQAAAIQETEQDLHEKISDLDKTKKEKSSLLTDQEKEKESLGKERSTQVKAVADLSKHEGLLRKQEEEVQRKIARTNRAIAAAIRREIEEARRKAEEEEKRKERLAAAAAKSSNKEVTVNKPRETAKSMTASEALNATPEAARLSSDFLGNRGQLPWPVSHGNLVQGFGLYYDDAGIKNESYGWDIRTNNDATVRAVFQGTVKTIQNISGTYLIVVQHGEYFTAYSNLRSYMVKVGDKVSTKQAIGTVATDSATGQAIVSFALYKGSTPVDPKIWLAPE